MLGVITVDVTAFVVPCELTLEEVTLLVVFPFNVVDIVPGDDEKEPDVVGLSEVDKVVLEVDSFFFSVVCGDAEGFVVCWDVEE